MSEPSRFPGPRLILPAAPWLALLLPPAAWYGYQQGLGAAARAACRAGGAPIGPALGLLALGVCAVAAWTAWPVVRTPASDPPGQARRFIAHVGLGGAALFALGVVFQLLAILIVPPCVP